MSDDHHPHHDDDAAQPACPSCHHTGPFRRHAVRPSWWRDVPQDGRPQVRRGDIIRWRCIACGQTHSSQPDWAMPGKRLTRALEAWVRQALQAGYSARHVARRCGVDEKTVRTWGSGQACQEG